MNGYHSDIEELTLNNNNFRKVLFTGKHMQLVVMSLKPSEEIGIEVHDNVDQFFRVESGEAKAVLDGEEVVIKKDEALIVVAGTEHNIINNLPDEDLKLYTIYSPANHPDGTINATYEDALAYEKNHH
jgi:mannose-6-phosphate isomerase-like protein (cupin superfamily)